MKIQYFIAIDLMRWLTTIFYDLSFKWTAIAAIGIHHTKAWLSQLIISKMQSGREDTLKVWYAKKFCFKLGKTYGMHQTVFVPSCMNRASNFEWHKRFKEGKESVRYDVRHRRSKEVNTPGLRLGLLCWGFKGVQEETPSEEANTWFLRKWDYDLLPTSKFPR